MRFRFSFRFLPPNPEGNGTKRIVINKNAFFEIPFLTKMRFQNQKTIFHMLLWRWMDMSFWMKQALSILQRNISLTLSEEYQRRSLCVKSIPCGSAHAEAQKKLSILWSDIVVASYRSSSTCQVAYWRQSYWKLFVVRSKCRTQDPIYCMSGYWKGSRVQRSYAYTCMHVRKLYKYISVQYKATNIKDQINRIIISGTFLEGKLR